MRVAPWDHVTDPLASGQPSVPANPMQVELFLAALNAPSSEDGDMASDDTSEAGGDSPLKHIVQGMRGGLAGISNDWEQARSMASDLEQRPVLDGSVIRDALKLVRTTSRVSVAIDVVSKALGKVSHTADVMSRG